MEFADSALLIMAGGQSSRLGQDKLFLEYDGVSLLERLLQKAAARDFREVFLCGGRDVEGCAALAAKYGIRFLPDEVGGRGPLAGLCSGLRAMTAEYALVVAADMPLWDFAAAAPLLGQTGAELAVIPVVGGRRQPLAGLYRRAILPQVEVALEDGLYKVGAVLAQVPCRWVTLPAAAAFFNLNTPADWRLLQGRWANAGRTVPVVTVTAPVSGTGKTTFIERLIPLLQAKGVRAGVVKSDSHGYELDEAGKDSYRFKAAGAQGVALVSPDGYFIEQRTAVRPGLVEIAARLENVDMVFIESRSRGVSPKISLWRGLGEPSVDAATAALFASEPLQVPDVACYPLAAVEKAAELVLFLCALEGKTAFQ